MRRPRLLVAGLVVLGTALAAELAARALFAPPEFFEGHPYDPELGFVSIPGKRYDCCDERGRYLWAVNSSGFRGPELPAPDEPAPEGVRRLLFIGDSFLEGWHVREEDLMPFSAATGLTARGLPAQSFVLDSSGYGTAQELLCFRRYGARVRPDWVVLCLYSGNDVIDNTLALAGRTRVSTGAWVRPYFVLDEAGELELTFLHPWRARLRRWSRLFAHFDRRAYVWRYREEGDYLRPEPDRPIDPHQRMAKGLVIGPDLELFLEPTPGDDWDVAWRTTEGLLATFQREVHALGARFLVVVIPHVGQVETNGLMLQAEANTLQAGQPSLLERLDWNVPERKFAAIFRRHGIEGVLLLEPLRAALRASGRSEYLYDIHLDTHGHAHAGALVAARLAELEAGGEVPVAAAAPIDGRPVDILSQLWASGGPFTFDEPRKDMLGYGWRDWGCEQYGTGPGWAMKADGWLVLRRDQRYVLECALPRQARFPVEVRVSIRNRLVARPLVVCAPGPLEILVDMHLFRPGPEWMPVLVQTFEDSAQGSTQADLILKGLRLVP